MTGRQVPNSMYFVAHDQTWLRRVRYPTRIIFLFKKIELPFRMWVSGSDFLSPLVDGICMYRQCNDQPYKLGK